MGIEALDIRDIAIMDAFPWWAFSDDKTVLTVGCGQCRLEYHLKCYNKELTITATDIRKAPELKEEGFTFKHMDILHPDLSLKSDVVICSQTLEHIPEWKIALAGLIQLANIRVIITVPYKASFHSPDHFHFWNDVSIRNYAHLAYPYSTAISKIRTKPEDAPKKGCFLIIIDKKQKYGI